MAGPSAEDRARVRSYLMGQAEKYDLVDIWPRVMGQRLALIEALDGVSDEQARWRPPSGEGEAAWSIVEVAQHIGQWTGHLLGVAEAMAAGRTIPSMPPVGHIEPDPEQTLAQVRRDLVQSSMRLAEFLGRPDAEANSLVEVEHGLFGPLNLRGWVLFQRVHDVDHVGQIQQLKAMDGFPAAPQ
ncbi:MAG: DinB family protein [Dehalococcoidia bacterium]|nr:DinB family protein [Dehalococcoidia bacterium]